MIKEALLMREANRVSSFIHERVQLVGAESRDEVLQLFETMYNFFPHWVITTCPKMHPEIHYVSQNCPFVFGFSREFLISIAAMERFMSHVHEDDQKDLFSCFTRVHTFLSEIPYQEHHLYRVVFHYRFRNADGEYIYLHDEKASLHLRGSNLYYVLFKDITGERSFGGVKLEFFRQDEVLNKIEEYRPSILRNPLTPREKDLVLLLRQGLSTKEVAGRLGISHHTVRNIKSKLFEKYNVTNSIELLNLTA